MSVGGVESSADAAPVADPPRRRRAPLWADLTVLAVIGALLVAAAFATAGTLYREFYSPSAFVERYVELVAEGRAAEALAMAGVAVDSAELEAAGLPATASDALLRRDAMAALSEIRVVGERTTDAGTAVTVEYLAGDVPGTTTFQVIQDGTVGLAPTWRFTTSPLAVLDLTVAGSRKFEVNGFEIDQRQVSPDGIDADPLAPVSLLVFSPGIYSVAVDTPVSATPGVAVVSDIPFAEIPVAVRAEPTPEFIGLVQARVDEFLAECTTQQVLQPTACPFGYDEQDRIETLPEWSIAVPPIVTLEPDGDGWKIPSAPAVAHIEMDVQSLFDGTIRRVSADVPFSIAARIEILPDGSATITVVSPENL